MEKLFGNAGKKIKILAMVLFIILAGGSVITGIVLLVNSMSYRGEVVEVNGAMMGAGLGTMLGRPVVS